MTDRELIQQALDALDLVTDLTTHDDVLYEAIDALRERLAQPEPEPVACPYCHNSHTLGAVYFDQNCAGCVKRMTAPPQREWQGLTDEQIIKLGKLDKDSDYFGFWYDFARAIEAKLKEKNNA